ncbi:hypothetical protein [Mycobacterium sp. HNNTM2301]|uniref:hypothetical protein n=1 Tax=Mycobacterium hainanense TaxID=3289775 RepID=UPI0035A67219
MIKMRLVPNVVRIHALNAHSTPSVHTRRASVTTSVQAALARVTPSAPAAGPERGRRRLGDDGQNRRTILLRWW